MLKVEEGKKYSTLLVKGFSGGAGMGIITYPAVVRSTFLLSVPQCMVGLYDVQ